MSTSFTFYIIYVALVWMITYTHTHTHTHIYIYIYIYTHTRSVYVRTHMPTTDIPHMVFTKNLNVPSSVNPLTCTSVSSLIQTPSNISPPKSVQPSPQLHGLLLYNQIYVFQLHLYPPKYTLLLCCNKCPYFLYVVKRKSTFYVYVCLPRCNVVHWPILIKLFCNTKHWRHCAEEFTETCSATFLLDSFCVRAMMDFCVLRNCDTFGNTCLLYLI
jgi:hypothetical protein